MTLRIAFMASQAAVAQTARAALITRYCDVPPEEADVIVALGGEPELDGVVDAPTDGLSETEN